MMQPKWVELIIAVKLVISPDVYTIAFELRDIYIIIISLIKY